MNMNVPKPLGIEFDFGQENSPKAELINKNRQKILSYLVWSLVGIGSVLIIASLSLGDLLIIAAVFAGILVAITALFVHMQNSTPWWS